MQAKNSGRGGALSALRCAFPYTVPILAGFCFLGASYGIYMRVSGFSVWYPLIMAAVIYGGSLEFVAVSLLLAPYAPLQTFLMALMIQARHLFYGIAMLDKFKGLGWKKPYLIFAMCDETFSINCSAEIPPEIDRGWFYFFVTLLNQLYWVGSATLGGLLGSLITIRVTGTGFLYNMVRIIAGTLIEVGNGKYPPEHIKEILQHCDRSCAGPTAPARGLTLVEYEFL